MTEDNIPEFKPLSDAERAFAHNKWTVKKKAILILGLAAGGFGIWSMTFDYNLYNFDLLLTIIGGLLIGFSRGGFSK